MIIIIIIIINIIFIIPTMTYDTYMHPSICINGRDILLEAYRILPKGGAIAIMDMNPDSTAFRRVSSNPFAFAAFKSTEPWIQEYVSMDLYNTLRVCGFRDVDMMENSPRHRTVVAYK